MSNEPRELVFISDPKALTSLLQLEIVFVGSENHGLLFKHELLFMQHLHELTVQGLVVFDHSFCSAMLLSAEKRTEKHMRSMRERLTCQKKL